MNPKITIILPTYNRKILLKQAILWKTNLPVLSTKRVFMYGNYPAISIYDKKIHIHENPELLGGEE